MSAKRTVPKTASIAEPLAGGKLTAPSAARNVGPIRDVLLNVAPRSGRALEIASGTGEHVVAFARAMPGLVWQPSEIDAPRRASIDAWVAEAGLPNLRPAVHLDATARGWAVEHAAHDLVVVINLVHLISYAEARSLIREAAAALAPKGKLFVYGPFLRDGQATSDGDARFHASLTAQDPEIGYKDKDEVIAWLRDAGLGAVDVIDMPANNLCLIAGDAEQSVIGG